MRRRFSKQATREETVDIETAVKMLISRLQETGKTGGLDPNQISRAQLSGLIERIATTDRTGNTRPLVSAQTGSSTVSEPLAGIEIILVPRTGRKFQDNFVLTPNAIIRTVAPFLNAIIAIQHVFNEVKGLPLRKIPVLEIRSQPVLSARLDGVSEAVYVIKGIVNSWRQKHIEQLSRLTTGTLQNKIERSTLDRSKVEMASQMLDLVKAGMTEKEKFGHLSALLPSIDVLILSELEIQ